MKASRRFAGLAVLLLLLASCEESFSPKTPFRRVPILYCVLEADYKRLPGEQQVVLSSTYDVTGYDPSTNSIDPAIRGAKIELQVHDRQYTLVESTAPRSDTLRYKTPQVFYIGTDVLLYPFDTITITAVLPDGSVLSAQSYVPSPSGIATSPQILPQGFTTKVNRSTQGSSFIVDWDNAVAEEHLFFPSLSIGYRVRTPLGDIIRVNQVPLRYVQRAGTPVPVFPSYQTEKVCVYEFDAIDEVMREISGGDPHKESYIITGMDFDLTEFDFPLSRFYASVNGYLDQYSVRLDESVFTNIRGGIGVFGCRMDSRWGFKLDRRYIESFGYRALESAMSK